MVSYFVDSKAKFKSRLRLDPIPVGLNFSGIVVGLLLLAIFYLYFSLFRSGVVQFWPGQIYEFKTKANLIYYGEIVERKNTGTITEIKIRHGAKNLLGSSFRWLQDNAGDLQIEQNHQLVSFEHMETGRVYGQLDENTKFLKISENKTIDLTPLLAHGYLYELKDKNFIYDLQFFLTRFINFLIEPPREANTEGGVLPAILGTVFLVFLMTLIVAPLGVFTAIYISEYSKKGKLIRLLTWCISNLASIPSIVFGMFGLGFFVYFVGSHIDKTAFKDALPNPTFGTGGVLWSSLTMALLTLPVVIVSTLESLRTIPRLYREGSLALGATKEQSLRKLIIPLCIPGMITGVILAIGRAAGEVAPLVLTGVVKMADEFPLTHQFPFVHFERKFMHLAFHIFDLAFQSPNVEESLPNVYMSTVVLLMLVLSLTLSGFYIRTRYRTKLATQYH